MINYPLVQRKRDSKDYELQKRVFIGVLEIQLSVKFSATSQLTVKGLAIFFSGILRAGSATVLLGFGCTVTDPGLNHT